MDYILCLVYRCFENRVLAIFFIIPFLRDGVNAIEYAEYNCGIQYHGKDIFVCS